MSTPKVISMTVRPLRVSNLCFEINGILENLDTELGASVPAFDFNQFYEELRSFRTEEIPPPSGVAATPPPGPREILLACILTPQMFWIAFVPIASLACGPNPVRRP